MNIFKLTMFVVASLSVVSAQAVTIATHEDPSTGTPNVFTVDTTNGFVSAGWALAGLDLNVPIVPTSFANLTMVMNPVAIIATTVVGPLTIHSLGAGEIRYYSSDINAPEFQINFSSASLVEPAVATAADLTGNNVVFSGSAISAYAGLLSNEVINYSFSNPESVANGTTYTASMTASADVVPEPATMVALGVGIAGLAARRRKSK